MAFLQDLLQGILASRAQGEQEGTQRTPGDRADQMQGQRRNAPPSSMQQQEERGQFSEQDLSQKGEQVYNATGEMIHECGDIPGLVKQFQERGFGPMVVGWVGTGANPKISPEEVAEGCGPEKIQEMARKTGLEEGPLTQILSQLLPKLVDASTPKGNVSGNQDFSQVLNTLKKQFLG